MDRVLAALDEIKVPAEEGVDGGVNKVFLR